MMISTRGRYAIRVMIDLAEQGSTGYTRLKDISERQDISLKYLETDKVYTRYTGYPGGQRFQTPAELRKRNGGVEKFLRHAVKGMLPKGPLGRSLLNNLYIYEGTEHPHEAQKPKAIDINQYK